MTSDYAIEGLRITQDFLETQVRVSRSGTVAGLTFLGASSSMNSKLITKSSKRPPQNRQRIVQSAWR